MTKRTGDKVEFTKPNCTITSEHDKMLDEIAEKRFASRSEALRVAIQQLHNQTVDDENISVDERLISKVDEISEKVDDLCKEIDELHEQGVHRYPSPDARTRVEVGELEKVESENDQSKNIEKDVYRLLSKEGPLSSPEIADRLGVGYLDVRETLESLAERGIIACVNEDGTNRYRTKSINE